MSVWFRCMHVGKRLFKRSKIAGKFTLNKPTNWQCRYSKVRQWALEVKLINWVFSLKQNFKIWFLVHLVVCSFKPQMLTGLTSPDQMLDWFWLKHNFLSKVRTSSPLCLFGFTWWTWAVLTVELILWWKLKWYYDQIFTPWCFRCIT